MLANYLVFATAWILGDNVRTHRKYVAELEDKALRLEAEREAQAQRAAVTDRGPRAGGGYEVKARLPLSS